MSRSARHASIDDLETLVDFTLVEAREAEGRELDRATVSRAIETALREPRAHASYLILEDEGEPVAHCSVFREWSDWRAVPYIWVQSMYVAPVARGTGAMMPLLEAVDQLAADEGAPEVRIYVHTDNGHALKAWQREGFTDAPYWMAQRPVRPS